jgi:nucleotide-binding universal stress UspA family protein
MYTRIFIPLDGSARSESVLPTAARLARASGGTLILFQVYDALVDGLPLSRYEQAAARSLAYLREMATRYHLTDLPLETETLGIAVARTILDAVQEYQADLIVMSSHGRSGLKRWALGSVAEQVVRHASIPVLVLHEQMARLPEADRTHPLHTLVALDGSPLAEQALEPALQLTSALAQPGPGVLHLVRIIVPALAHHPRQAASPSQNQPQEQMQQDAAVYLRAVVEQVQARTPSHLHVTWSTLTAEDIALALIGEASRMTPGEVGGADQYSGASLIALATHGRGGLERWRSGSIAARVLEGTERPLLIVHPS